MGPRYNLPVDPSSFVCPVCRYGFETDFLDSMRIHAQKKHGLKSRDLYIRLFLDGIEPKCKCGCGETPKFWTLQRGFAEYVRGHHSRVKNNWGHNESAQAKSQDVRREMHKRGEIPIWNKGETKETDERVAAYGQIQSENFTPERREIRSKRMTKNRLDKTVPDLRGKDHGMWKGGTSALQPIVRSRLHYAWAYPKLRSSGFKCVRCDKPGPGLEVHHDCERFASILHKAIASLGEAGDDFEKKSAIADWVVAYHVNNDVSGIVLCEDCHEKAHAAS